MYAACDLWPVSAMPTRGLETLFAVAVATPFLPPPRDGTAFAWQALAGYVVLAALAGWLDRGATTTNDPRSAE